jgi:hypothetical protein
MASAAFVLILFAVALAATLAVEALVALAFRGGSRGVLAVSGTNLVTNPLFNLVLLLAAYILGAGGPDWAPHGWLLLPLTIALEVLVVAVEWRILVYVTRGTWGSSRRLLLFSVVANLASALAPLGLWLLLNLASIALQS